MCVTSIDMCDSEENVMSKGLEALKELLRNHPYHEEDCDRVVIIEKELKALEIIKNKCVDCWAFISDISVTSEEESVYSFSPIDLTKEEVELLKEVLL